MFIIEKRVVELLLVIIDKQFHMGITGY